MMISKSRAAQSRISIPPMSCGAASVLAAVRHTPAIAISSIVASELRFGYLKRGSDRLTQLVENMIARVEVISYDEAAPVHYAQLRHSLQMSGTPIGPVDLFIAAHARSRPLP